MYGQIISFLFVLLILYYVVMILLDIQKAKAAKAAELEKNSEEEIDISDEAQTFKPVLISRDEPQKVQAQQTSEDACQDAAEASEDKLPTDDKESKETAPQKSENESDQNIQGKTGKADNTDDSKAAPSPETQEEKPDHKPFRREGYREALMTDGLEVERLIEEAEVLAETGKGPLGGILYDVRSA